MSLFKAVDVVKQFANHRALSKVSMEVPEKSIYGLLGPNGAGKTTLIRIINQITAPDEGELFLMGRPLQSEDTKLIGYLPEERGLYKKMKVGEQALYFAQLKGISKRQAMKELKHWFEKFEIQAWWDKKVEELSKGMQQKVQFIITVIHKPPFLIFDEPFSGFDPINTNLLKKEILKLRDEGSTVIFSTHNMESVEELCDHITLIDNSRSILNGNVQAIRQSYKAGIFEISLQGNPDKFHTGLNGRFEVTSIDKEADKFTARIKMNEKDTGNELLKALINDYHVLAFAEVLPSMNDIFISAIENEKTKR
jgi:ABC-2 type transport system ATP-binding protein